MLTQRRADPGYSAVAGSPGAGRLLPTISALAVGRVAGGRQGLPLVHFSGNRCVFGQMPAVFGQMPAVFGHMPAVFGQMPAVFGQITAVSCCLPRNLDAS